MDTTVASLRDGHLTQDALGPLGVGSHDLKAATINQKHKDLRVFLESAKCFMPRNSRFFFTPSLHWRAVFRSRLAEVKLSDPMQGAEIY